jgi:hypothetical protein
VNGAFASCLALGAVLFLASPAPAVAAGEAPSPELDRFYLRLSSGPRNLSRMAGCLVNQHPDDARRLFDYAFDSEAHYQALQEFWKHGGNCLFGTWELRSTNILFLGAVAEQLTARDDLARPVAAAGHDGPSFQLGGGSHLWTWRNLTDRAAARALPLADCLLARHADQVHAVLDARQTSDGERKLFNALNDEIDGCVPAGESWTLQPQILRAGLAIAYYKSARTAAAHANNGTAG